MPAFLIYVSANVRKKLYKTILGLSVCSGCLSLLLMGCLAYSYIRHSLNLHAIVINIFDDVYINLAVLAIRMFLVPAVCWKLARNIKHQPTNHALDRAGLMWAGSVSLCCLTVALSASSLSLAEQAVVMQLLPRYKHGLQHYLDSSEWHTAMDRTQSNLQCCGANGPADWYTTSWIPFDLLSNSSGDITQYSRLVQPDGHLLVPLVPTTCCRPGTSDCGHLSWLQHPTPDPREAEPAHLYTQGCAPAIASVIAMDFLYFKFLMLIIFLLQVGMLVTVRYFYTSSLNCLILGQTQGGAPGWLVGTIFGNRESNFGYLAKYQEGYQEDHQEDYDKPKKKLKLKCLAKCKRKKEPQTDSKRNILQSPCIAKIKEKCRMKKKGKSTAQSESELLQEEQTEDESKEDEPLARSTVSANMIDVLPMPFTPQNPETYFYAENSKQENPFVNKSTEPLRQVGFNIPTGPVDDRISLDGAPNRPKTSGRDDTERDRDFEAARRIFKNLESVSKKLPQANFVNPPRSSSVAVELQERLVTGTSTPRRVSSSRQIVNESPPPVLRNYKLPNH